MIDSMIRCHAKRAEPKAETALSYENPDGADGRGTPNVRQRPNFSLTALRHNR